MNDIRVGFAELPDDDTIDIADTTVVTFAVNDPSGALLHFKSEDFKPQLEFTWEIPPAPLPPGSLTLVVEIGDRLSGIHTHKEFAYRVASKLTATAVEVPEGLSLSDLLRVRMTPALLGAAGPIPFLNEKPFDSLTDAAGEAFYPQTAAESQRYLMRIKVAGAVVKAIEGEVIAIDNKLVVDFETAVDETLDFATGFALDFQFRAESGTLTPLAIEAEPFVNVLAAIVAEGDPLVASHEIAYGGNITASFGLKDQEAGRQLAPGRAYPVIVVIAKDDGKILLEKKCKYVDERYSVKAQIGAAIPPGNIVVAIRIRKAGGELVNVNTTAGELYESAVRVTGAISFSAKVKEQGKYAIVSFTASSAGRNLSGTAFSCTIVDSAGETVAVLPLAQKEGGSELTWDTQGAKGAYSLQLRRLAAPEGAPLFVQQLALDTSFAEVVTRLPVEGLAIAFAFALFAWSIRLRSSIRKR